MASENGTLKVGTPASAGHGLPIDCAWGT